MNELVPTDSATNVLVLDSVAADAEILTVTDLLEIDPVLTDFFWLELAVRLQDAAKEANSVGIVRELDAFFRGHPETLWTCAQVESAFDSLIRVLVDGNAHFSRSKVARRTRTLLLGKQKEEIALELLCQMRFYFQANPNKDDPFTGQNIADINEEITILA